MVQFVFCSMPQSGIIALCWVLHNTMSLSMHFIKVSDSTVIVPTHPLTCVSFSKKHSQQKAQDMSNKETEGHHRKAPQKSPQQKQQGTQKGDTESHHQKAQNKINEDKGGQRRKPTPKGQYQHASLALLFCRHQAVLVCQA